MHLFAVFLSRRVPLTASEGGWSIAENESVQHQGKGVNRPGDGRNGETAHRGKRPSRDSAPKAESYRKALRWREPLALAPSHRHRRVTYRSEPACPHAGGSAASSVHAYLGRIKVLCLHRTSDRRGTINPNRATCSRNTRLPPTHYASKAQALTWRQINGIYSSHIRKHGGDGLPCWPNRPGDRRHHLSACLIVKPARFSLVYGAAEDLAGDYWPVCPYNPFKSHGTESLPTAVRS